MSLINSTQTAGAQATGATSAKKSNGTEKREKHASNAPNVPSLSMTAPNIQTPSELPETIKNSVRAAVPVMIASELYNQIAEYGAANGNQTPEGLITRALIGYLDRQKERPAQIENVKIFQRICKHYRDVLLSSIDDCELTPEQEATERKKAAVFGALFESPKTSPFAFHYFLDSFDKAFVDKIGRELDALDIVYDALNINATPETLA